MPITDRQKDILWAIIEEYAKKAEPISSKTLARQRGFDIGAPMIRKEMNQLEQLGFLVSPHTSAGRVPTDRAYRLYIQEKIENKSTELTQREKGKVNELVESGLPEHALLNAISKTVSEISKELSVAGTADGRMRYFCGLANLSEEPEFRVFENLNHQLMRFMDNFDTHFDHLFNDLFGEGLSVFVGEENPIKEISEFTLITGRYHLPDGESSGSDEDKQGFISIIGPKRMNYRRNIALVGYISETLNGI